MGARCLGLHLLWRLRARYHAGATSLRHRPAVAVLALVAFFQRGAEGNVAATDPNWLSALGERTHFPSREIVAKFLPR